MNPIFAHFISRKDDDMKRLAYAGWFVQTLPQSEFDGDELLFYKFLEYCVELGVPAKQAYLGVWCNTELRRVLRATDARVPGCESMNYDDPVSFETAIKATIDILNDDYNALESIEANLDDFKVSIATYFHTQQHARITQALSTAYTKLNDTDDVVMVSDYLYDTLTAIRELYSDTAFDNLDVDLDNVLDDVTMERVTDCGLPAIDSDSGGIFTKQLVGIEAQPGAGKTRFSLGTWIYRAVTLYKKNVIYYSLEQSEAEIRAMLIARHVFSMFEYQISDSMITRNEVPDDLKTYVEAAKFDLFKSGKYGKIVIRETDLFVESFIGRLRNDDRRLGPFDLVCIDYMGLISSKPAQYQREKSEYEVIRDSYKLYKRYVRNNRKAGIAVAQFNREGIAAGKADKEITTEMAQGGLAVYRNTDYNVSMSMTDTMRAQRKRRFSQPKVRASNGFGTFIADTRLGFCWFNQVAHREV